VQVGDIVTVEVLRIEPDKKREGHMRIALSLKAAMPDPFEAHRDQIIAGQTLEGKVARLETFGAFIELFDGVDGLIHISELSEQRVRHPSEVLTIGNPVTVRILDVDFEKRRVSLSLRENVQREKETHKERPHVQAMARGALSDGVVERIERYGVFLKLANGQTALLPSSETGTPRGADLSKFYELGSSHQVMVIDIDDRGRVRVSKVAREKADERADYEHFSQKFTKGSKGGLGTLGDLLSKKLNKP
jgi:small subunit ribosomal protein S1